MRPLSLTRQELVRQLIDLSREFIVKRHFSFVTRETKVLAWIISSMLLSQASFAATVTVREGGQDVATGCSLTSMSGTPSNVIVDVGAGCLPQGGSSGVTVYPTSLDMDEGASQNVSIALHNPPTANVTVNLTSSDTTELTLGSSSVFFTPTNYFQPQSVLFRAEQDSISDGDNNVTVSTSVSSTDTNYNGIASPSVTAIVRNSTSNPNSDPGTSPWSPSANVFVVATTDYDPYSSNRSYYPECQEKVLAPSPQSSCNVPNGSLSVNNWPEGKTFSERLLFGTAVPKTSTVTVQLALAEVGESTTNWDVAISTRPGEFRTPTANLSQNPDSNNSVNCKKFNAAFPTFFLLRNDHTTNPAFGEEGTSCVLEPGKVYYLDMKPTAGFGCGTTKKCAVSVKNFIAPQIIGPSSYTSFFPYTLPSP